MKKEMETVKTSSGLTYNIDPDALDDMEVFEDLMVMEDPDERPSKKMAATNRVFRRLIGEEQKEKLDHFLKERDGRVRISAYTAETKEIFDALNPSKKK